MDARSFGNFLTTKIEGALSVIESNLLNGSYQTGHQHQQAVGARLSLKDMVDGMENIVSEFYNRGGNSVPQNSVVSDMEKTAHSIISDTAQVANQVLDILSPGGN